VSEALFELKLVVISIRMESGVPILTVLYGVMPAKAGIQYPANYRWDSCCADIEGPWLLDRPVKPGDDSNGIQALEAVH
jgi:hypothetical protein